MSVSKKDESIFVPVSPKPESALQDPSFQNVQNQVQQWLANPKRPLGKEMDSVFFHNDRFELMIDTRGYRPEEVKCTVAPTSVEVIAERQELAAGAQRSMATTRSYQLPQNVLPQHAVCCLSSEGILLVTVPWQK